MPSSTLSSNVTGTTYSWVVQAMDVNVTGNSGVDGSALFIGAIGYLNKDLDTSSAKIDLINKIKKLSDYDLTSSTLFREEKFNLFVWRPIDSEDGDAL